MKGDPGEGMAEPRWSRSVRDGLLAVVVCSINHDRDVPNNGHVQLTAPAGRAASINDVF